MPYNPEFNLWADQQIKDLRVNTGRVRDYLPDSSLVALLDGMDNLLAIAFEIRKDYEECFDEDKKQALMSELKDVLTKVEEANNLILRSIGES